MPTPVYKPPGLTPLETVRRFRLERNIADTVPVSYAGRLDPLAEGVLLVLIGDENKNRRDFERLSKEYEFEILFGISTDSYDIMGKIIAVKNPLGIDFAQVSTLISSYKGTFDQTYPPYSSVRLLGKPLYYWARQGKIENLQLPHKNVHITRIFPGAVRMEQFHVIYHEIQRRIRMVHGAFRQEEILNLWDECYHENPEITFPILPVSVSTSNGLYIRSVCHDVGTKLGIPALAWNIRRTHVGEFSIADCYIIQPEADPEVLQNK